MAKTKVSRVRINQKDIVRICNGPKAQALLRSKAQQLNRAALRWYMIQYKGKGTPPTFYHRSFKIRRIRKKAIAAFRAYNDDPTALWVEFGAHAGGKTAVLKYRPYGKALDELAVRE